LTAVARRALPLLQDEVFDPQGVCPNLTLGRVVEDVVDDIDLPILELNPARVAGVGLG